MAARQIFDGVWVGASTDRKPGFPTARSGNIFFERDTKAIYVLLQQWTQFGGGGSSGSVAWPDITGDQSTVNLSGFNNDAGFLTSFTETDPTVSAAVKAITATQIGNWDVAFGWGDHAAVGYLTAEANDLTAVVTWADVPDANITQSSVVQHEDALSIDADNIVASNTPTDGQVLSFDAASGSLLWVDPQVVSGALALTSISPTTGDEAGSTAVTLTGENFDTGAAATVNFGVNAATGVTVDSATQISATTPANEKPVLMDSAKKGSNITLDATGLIVSNESGIDDLSQAILADTSKSAGKHYAEFVITEVTAPITAGVGLAPDAFAFSTDWAGKGSSYAHWKSGLFTGGSNVNSKSFATGDVIMVAFDADAGKIWFGKNGTWYDSGDPGAGTGEQFSGVTGAYAITVTPWDDGSIVDVVTESGELSHTIPTGFDPWIKTVAESVDVTVTQGSESGTLAAAFEYTADVT